MRQNETDEIRKNSENGKIKQIGTSFGNSMIEVVHQFHQVVLISTLGSPYQASTITCTRRISDQIIMFFR